MRPLMSRQHVINPLEFARDGGRLAGALDIALLTRLQELLYCDQGTVNYSLDGAVDSKARPALRIHISGTIVVQCQRCLGPLSILLKLSSSLMLAEKGQMPDSEALEDPSLDWIPAEEEIDPAALVEEEILLALPMSPRHPEAQCSAPQPESRFEQRAFSAPAGLSSRAKNR